MARKERLVAVALAFKGLQLGCHIHLAVLVVANVKRYDANRVASDKKRAILDIVKGESEDAGQALKQRHERRRAIGLPLTIEGQDDLAVGTRLILVIARRLADGSMVVNLTVHGKHLFLVGREERLPAAFRVDNGKTLMAQYGRLASVDATPVGAAMTYFLTHTQRLLAQFGRLLTDIEYSYYSTHNLFLVFFFYDGLFINSRLQPNL